MLGTPGFSRIDDSGMAPAATPGPIFGGGQMRYPMPTSNRFPHRLAFLMQRYMGQQGGPGALPPQANPTLPPQAQQVTPQAPPAGPSGATLGQLFSGYGY